MKKIKMINAIGERDILRSLKTKQFGTLVYAFDQIDSTNYFAKRLASQGAPEGTLVYAEKQIRGRGRWGRLWDSPEGKGLWFSIIVRPALSLSSGTLLTMLGVTSVVWSIEKLLGLSLYVRWPNDIFLDDKKLAGVITETSGRHKKISYAVLGIGVNVNQEIEDFAPDIRDKAISLRVSSGCCVDRLSLLSNILFQLEKDFIEAKNKGFGFVLRRWVSRSNILGRVVQLRVNSHTEKGVVRGFHANGDIILTIAAKKEKRFSEGDIIEVGNVIGN